MFDATRPALRRRDQAPHPGLVVRVGIARFAQGGGIRAPFWNPNRGPSVGRPRRECAGRQFTRVVPRCSFQQLHGSTSRKPSLPWYTCARPCLRPSSAEKRCSAAERRGAHHVALARGASPAGGTDVDRGIPVRAAAWHVSTGRSARCSLAPSTPALAGQCRRRVRRWRSALGTLTRARVARDQVARLLVRVVVGVRRMLAERASGGQSEILPGARLARCSGALDSRRARADPRGQCRTGFSPLDAKCVPTSGTPHPGATGLIVAAAREIAALTSVSADGVRIMGRSRPARRPPPPAR